MPIDPRVLAAMSEREFLEQVRRVARREHWLTYHNLHSKGSEPGFPDLVLLKRGVLWFAELKREKEYPTPDQATWLAGLAAVEVVLADVLRPSQEPEIATRLAHGGGRPWRKEER